MYCLCSIGQRYQHWWFSRLRRRPKRWFGFGGSLPPCLLEGTVTHTVQVSIFDWSIEWSMDRLIDWLINLHLFLFGLIDCLIFRCLVDWSIDWLIDWVIDIWLIEWSISLFSVRVIDWLIDWWTCYWIFVVDSNGGDRGSPGRPGRRGTGRLLHQSRYSTPHRLEKAAHTRYEGWCDSRAGIFLLAGRNVDENREGEYEAGRH